MPDEPKHDDVPSPPTVVYVPAAGAGAVTAGRDASLAPETIAPSGSPSLEPVSATGGIIGYEIMEELGRGGMGVVYKARQIALNRIVALKLILAGAHAGKEELARFRNEAETIARLQHPHIVQIYEIGESGGVGYLSLEFCAGGSLASKVSGTPLPPDWAAQLVETLARAVHVAHQNGVVHRDLKPGNILLTEDGSPKITDFGLAKKLDDVGQTASGTVLGTPGYMAPEQARGNVKEVGPAADVYALGAMLYEFLVGRPPFKADTAWDTLSQVINDEVIPPRNLQAAVPRDLETVCLKCLEKDPAARYASAESLADDLGCFLRGEDVSARPVALPGRIVRWARRRPALAATFVALLLFYALHLSMRLAGLGPEDEGFHWFAKGAVVVWAAGASVFQWLCLKPRLRTSATFAWAALDVVLLTALLIRGGGSKSSFLPAYLLLVAAAGLRFRVGLVWFVTGLCVVSYVVVDGLTRWHRPDSAGPLHGSIFFVVSLLLLGLCFQLVLGRVRESSLNLDR